MTAGSVVDTCPILKMRKMSSRRSTKEPLVSGNPVRRKSGSSMLLFNYHDNLDVSSQKGLSKQVGAQRAFSGFALVSEHDSPLEKTPLKGGRREAWP